MQDDISAVKQKNKDLTTTVNETDKALAFMNEDVEELKTQQRTHKIEIEKLDEKIRYMEVYQRRENLRFNRISENAAEEDTREVIYKFLENQLGIDRAREIEFQRVHRIGKKKQGKTRPIIVRLLCFQNRELVYSRAVEKRDSLGTVNVSADLPKEIRESRKKLWPHLRKARSEGKTAFFSRPEPDKLWIDGVHFKPAENDE